MGYQIVSHTEINKQKKQSVTVAFHSLMKSRRMADETFGNTLYVFIPDEPLIYCLKETITHKLHT